MDADELKNLLSLYGGRGTSSRGLTTAMSSVPARKPAKRKAPRTHLHAELLAKRRDPAPSVKTAVRDALKALATTESASDNAAVEKLMAREGETPVPGDWQQRYKTDARVYWDHFYRERTVNFFKDRHYLREEFAELMPASVIEDPRRWIDHLEVTEAFADTASMQELGEALRDRLVVLEVGCAVGNGIIPLLRANSNIFGVACDLAPVAVNLLREKEEYKCGRCFAFPSDIALGSDTQPTAEHKAIEDVVPSSSVDFTTLLFVLSAIDPKSHKDVAVRLRNCLKIGGVALFRDYGRGDLAQLRFAPGHWMGGDLYVRGDGTLAAFFTVDGLRDLFEDAGFEVLDCEYRRTEVVNRGTNVRMPRVWVQGKFRRVR